VGGLEHLAAAAKAAAPSGLPPWATVVLGLATAAVGVAGVVGTYFGARRQAATTIRAAVQNRFAGWQVTKRQVYADFLAAARDFRASGAGSERDEYLKQAERTRLYAYKKAREFVDELVAGEKDLKDDAIWTQLQRLLRDDVFLWGDAT
jgi:hypothetical protein